jgi:ketosteroid isomerase-like protein
MDEEHEVGAQADRRAARGEAPAGPPPREHPNAARVRALFEAFRARDVDAIRGAIAETAVWHFPGRAGRLAGAHVGHAGIFAFFARVGELTGGSFHLELEDVLANDQRAVALFRGRGRREGRELDNPTCLVIRLEAGRAVEVREFVWDLFEVDRFWS